jgi:hypothetical protein
MIAVSSRLGSFYKRIDFFFFILVQSCEQSYPGFTLNSFIFCTGMSVVEDSGRALFMR